MVGGEINLNESINSLQALLISSRVTFAVNVTYMQMNHVFDMQSGRVVSQLRAAAR